MRSYHLQAGHVAFSTSDFAMFGRVGTPTVDDDTIYDALWKQFHTAAGVFMAEGNSHIF